LIEFAGWWFIIQLFGLAALPLTRRVCAWLPDQGVAFSKTIGLLLVSYLLWVGASTGLLVNNPGGITFSLLLVGLVSGLLLLAQGGRAARREWSEYWQHNRRQILVIELLFLVTFAGWTLVRAFTPDKILPMGGEKYMEIAFLNGVLNSPHFPPLDPWMSGYAISYYYFGYIMMGVMTAFSGVASGVGFDLYDALLFSLTAINAYGVVANLVRAAGGSQRASSTAGLLGALFVGGLGNLLGLFEGLYSSRALPQSFFTWLNIPDLTSAAQSGSFYPGHGWWWWRASRVLMDLNLRYEPSAYQPIDEFPFFSFLLGDNHPHKLALPFVILVIGLAFNLWLKALAPSENKPGLPHDLRGWRSWSVWAGLNRANAGLFLFYALALGGLGFLNTWDIPIYLALVVLADLMGHFVSSQRAAGPDWLALLLRGLVLGICLGAASILVYIFFYLGFSSQAGGVLPYIFPPTRLPQYLVMFGPFVLILAFFLPLVVWQMHGREKPFAGVISIWLRTVGILYGIYLLVVLLGTAVLSATGLQNEPLIQSWLNGFSLQALLPQIFLARLRNPWLFLLLSALLAVALSGILHAQPSRSARATPFAILLAALGIGLTLTVEFFFLRDNFGARMNTIFKFYFQGWVLMALASAYGVWWVSRNTPRGWRIVFQGITALLVCAGLVYPVMAVYSRTEGFSRAPILDAAASFSGAYPGHWAAQPDDWAAVQWLVKNGVDEDGKLPILLEAGAGGYENAGRISAFTGFPTLLGWTNHEVQWRGSSAEIAVRAPVIAEIYTTSYASVALDLLKKWRVRYVIVGNAERQYIEKECQNPDHPCNTLKALTKFDEALTPVFTQGGTTIYQVPE
jgi:YYY domain-containing protein